MKLRCLCVPARRSYIPAEQLGRPKGALGEEADTPAKYFLSPADATLWNAAVSFETAVEEVSGVSWPVYAARVLDGCEDGVDELIELDVAVRRTIRECYQPIELEVEQCETGVVPPGWTEVTYARKKWFRVLQAPQEIGAKVRAIIG
jgi:hypothetical protein